MKERLEALRVEALKELQKVNSPQELNDLRDQVFGEKRRTDGNFARHGCAERRRTSRYRSVGNDVRGAIESVIEAKQADFQARGDGSRLRAETT